MRRLLALAFVLLAVPASAQIQPSGFARGVTPPIFGLPASAVNGSGTLSTACLTYPSGTTWCEVSDGILKAANAAGTGFTRIILGTNDGSGAALKKNGTGIDFISGNDGAFSNIRANNITNAGGGAWSMSAPIAINTAITVTSAGTSPSITTNGSVTGRVNVGTGGTATTIVLAMPTATTGWNCTANNITAAAANRANQAVKQQSSTTTAATIQNQTVSTGAALAFTASDIVSYICFAY